MHITKSCGLYKFVTGSWVKVIGERIFWKHGARSHRLRAKCFLYAYATLFLQPINFNYKMHPLSQSNEGKRIKSHIYFLQSKQGQHSLYSFFLLSFLFGFFLIFNFVFSLLKRVGLGNPYQT